MGSTLIFHVIHIIFSTKLRQPFITDAAAPRLYPYLGGIARHRQCDLLAVGGMPDHIHLLISVHPVVALADLVRDLKANSSRFMHEELAIAEFAWQTGYAAFSVSKSSVEGVRDYIAAQREHHASRSFSDELVDFLRRNDITYDERYILT